MAVMSLYDLDVVALGKGPRCHIDQAKHQIDADRHVGREDYRDIARGILDGELALGGETGGAYHQMHAAASADFEMRQRALRSREVDQAVDASQCGLDIVMYGHAAGGADQFSGILAEISAAGLVKRRGEHHVFALSDGFDQGAAHAAGATGNGNSDFFHGDLLGFRSRRGSGRLADLEKLRLRLNSTGLAGHHVSGDARELAVREVHHDAALLRLAVTRLEAIDIIPAVGVEDVGHQRRAQNEANLILGLTGLELGHHFLGNVIALAHVDAIRGQVRRDVWGAGAGSRKRQGERIMRFMGAYLRAGISNDCRKLYHKLVLSLPACPP